MSLQEDQFEDLRHFYVQRNGSILSIFQPNTVGNHDNTACFPVEDTEMIVSTLNAFDLLIGNPVMSEEMQGNSSEIDLFHNESNDPGDSMEEKSTKLTEDHTTLEEYEEPVMKQNTVNQVIDRHFQDRDAVLKLWNITASELLLIPCQLKTLKQSAILNSTVSIFSENPKTKIYICDICGGNFNELRSFLLHYEQIHRLFKCPFCVKYFSRKALLKEHLFRHSEKREFACSTCKKQFKCKRDLQQHVRGQHSIRAYTAETFLCDSCGFQTKSKNSIRSHVLRHLGVRLHVCDVCDKRCKNRVDLKDHRNAHFDIKSYQCDICKMCFTRKYTMMKHRQTLHEAMYSYMCDICGRSFLYKTSLAVHLKLHKGENRMECDLCGKIMSSKTALLNHKKIHSQQSDFVCGICGKMYIDKYSLQEHLLVHTGSKPFQCLQCDSSFSSRKKLLMHERIHDPHRTLHKCTYCGKSYLTKFKLKDHVRKHHVTVDAGLSSRIVLAS